MRYALSLVCRLSLLLVIGALASSATAQQDDLLRTSNQTLDHAEQVLKSTDRQLDGSMARWLDRCNRPANDRVAIDRGPSDTGAMATILQDRLDRIDARIAELDPVPKDVREASDIGLQHRQLASERAPSPIPR